MIKNDYTIGGRQFHVEKRGKEWCGWFLDDPDTQFSDQLKLRLLCKRGYRPSSGFDWSMVGTGVSVLQISMGAESSRTMQDAYTEILEKVRSGRSKTYPSDKPLSRFDIWFRDGCECIYCGTVPQESALINIEHVVAWSRGGKNEAGNVTVACHNCNHRKSNRRIHNEAAILLEISRRNSAAGIRDDHGVDLFDNRQR